MVNNVIKLLMMFFIVSCLDLSGDKNITSFKDVDKNNNQIYDRFEEWVEKEDMHPRLEKAYLLYGKFAYLQLLRSKDSDLSKKMNLAHLCLLYLDEWEKQPGFSNVYRIREARKILYDNSKKKAIERKISEEMSGFVGVLLSDENENCTTLNI